MMIGLRSLDCKDVVDVLVDARRRLVQQPAVPIARFLRRLFLGAGARRSQSGGLHGAQEHPEERVPDFAGVREGDERTAGVRVGAGASDVVAWCLCIS